MIPSSVMDRVRAYWQYFVSAGEKYGLDPALVAAVATRETNIRNVRGADGHGTGIMQIDDRYHSFAKTDATWNPASNIDYGASVLAGNYNQAASAGLDSYSALKAAVAGYNAGASRCVTAAKSGRDPDAYTTGGDYSRDVLARADEIKAVVGGGGSLTEKKNSLPAVWMLLGAAALI